MCKYYEWNLLLEGMVIDWMLVWEKFWVENADEVAQQTVGMEGRLFVEMIMGQVAGVDVALQEGAEAGIGLIVSSETGVGEGGLAVIFHEPDVSILCFIEYGLERKGDAATSLTVGKEVVSTGIGEHDAHGALTAGYEPLAAVKQFGEKTHPLLYVRGFGVGDLFQGEVVAFHFMEDAVGAFGYAKELTVEAYPLCAGQR